MENATVCGMNTLIMGDPSSLGCPYLVRQAILRAPRALAAGPSVIRSRIHLHRPESCRRGPRFVRLRGYRRWYPGPVGRGCQRGRIIVERVFVPHRPGELCRFRRSQLRKLRQQAKNNGGEGPLLVTDGPETPAARRSKP